MARWLVVIASLAAACVSRPPSAPTTPPSQIVSANHAPTVTAAFDGPSSCTPLPPYVPPDYPKTVTPCTLRVVARASDRDGDPLTYAWSGCASGTSPQADCIVNQPGPVTASVEVSDGQTHRGTDGHASRATASAQGEGINHTPVVRLSPFVRLAPASPNLSAMGGIYDAEEGDECSANLCLSVKSITVSGDCRPAYAFNCTCREGLGFDVYPIASNGTCTASFAVADWWGAIGTTMITIPYTGFTTGLGALLPAGGTPGKPRG